MHRRSLTLTLAICSLTATFAQAESSADQITRQLRDQGFSQITIAQTWLGRTRIVGQSKSGQREIILNPRTGEILRDLFTEADGQSSGNTVIRNTNTGGGGHNNGGNGSSGGEDGRNSGGGGSADGEDNGNSGTDDDPPDPTTGEDAGDSGTNDDPPDPTTGEDPGDSGSDDDGNSGEDDGGDGNDN